MVFAPVFTQQFTIRGVSRNGVACLALSGELDMGTVPVLEDHLADVENTDVKTIILDLRELTFIDSSGLHAFIDSHLRARTGGRRLILLGVGPSIRRLVELTNTMFLLDDPQAASVLDQFTGANIRPSTLTTIAGVSADV